ncbi:MAG: hypothetical protein JNM58_05400 [Xanthomonadaceae bacterium]|nr:hypothetical protein [Xanthomonadaceae bacterium]
MGSTHATHDLSPSAELAWGEALDEMDRMREQGDALGALKMARKAWDILPEPKLHCSYAYITAMPLLKTFIAAKDFEDGIAFADHLISTTPRSNEIPVFWVQKGILMYEQGDIENARAAFQRAWDIGGTFGFADEDKKYLSLLPDRR